MRFIVFLALFIHGLNALYAAEIQVTTRHYQVQGNDSASIRNNINRLGPTGKSGKRFHAYTQWNIRWNYRWVESNRQCKINRVEVAVDIDILLPELVADDQQAASLQQGWDRYYQALQKHEHQHRDFGIAAAREMEQKLQTLDGWMDCDELEKTADQLANEVIDHYAEKEREFDRRTDHGAKDGVVLPQ